LNFDADKKDKSCLTPEYCSHIWGLIKNNPLPVG